MDADSNGIPDECEEGEQEMLAGGGAGGESANSSSDTASSDAGETPAPRDRMYDHPAVMEFFEWQKDERDAQSAIGRAGRFNATRAKLIELGLPAAIPWARVSVAE